MDKDYFRILGAVGTGKTVVLIKRAIRLAEKYKNKIIRIFVSENSLASEIRKIIKTKSNKQQTNLYVHTFHEFFSKILEILKVPCNIFVSSQQNKKEIEGVENFKEGEIKVYDTFEEFLRSRKIFENDELSSSYPNYEINNKSEEVKDLFNKIKKIRIEDIDNFNYNPANEKNIENGFIKKIYEEKLDKISLLIIKEIWSESKEKGSIEEFQEIIKVFQDYFSIGGILENLYKKINDFQKFIEYLREEIKYISCFLTYKDYLECERKGRKYPLSSLERLMMIYLTEDFYY